ncbi:MAG TPA: homocysteine S-methyltransferase family protein [Kiloniellales bacterium]|nr:homocysteine S-methyltransferase family protein [Kiloniellales bacterium]
MASAITLLDGGMGRELERMGAPFRQPEWSALALIEEPDYVRWAHASFIGAGAEVITTNSYALVPFHLGAERFAMKGEQLADLAGRLARQAASEVDWPVTVAGGLPPLFGSYRPDLFDAKRAPELIRPLIAGLSPHVDLWLAETQSSIAEVEAAAAALEGDERPLWVSYTLRDEDYDAAPALRSGEAVGAAARAARRLGARALLFNCSQPEVIAPALAEARRALADAPLPLGAYANAFPPTPKDARANDDLSPLRRDLDPPGYLSFARAWVKEGATLVGGCCGIGPEHIAELKQALTG